jgi:hypothetical protein
MKAQRGRRGIVELFLNIGYLWGWVIKAAPRPLYPRQRELVPIVK